MTPMVSGPVSTSDILLSISFAHEILHFLYVSLHICYMCGIIYQLQSTKYNCAVSGFFSVLLIHSSLLWIRGEISNRPM